jgi:probable HAF family extracellular repeat protein
MRSTNGRGSNGGWLGRRLFGWALFALTAGLAAAGAQDSVAKVPAYSITDLGTLPGDTTSAAFAINASGQVVGYSGDEFGEADARPVLFSGGTVTPLGFADPQDFDGIALGINGGGQAVGFTETDVVHAALFTGVVGSDLGRLSSVPAPGEDVAYGINSLGQAVGYSQPKTGDPAARPDGAQAILFSGGTVTGLGALPGDSQSVAYAINTEGQAVGYSQGATRERAVLFSGGEVTDLGVLSGDLNSGAFAINDSGEVVGYSGGLERMHAVLFQAGAVINLGALPGDLNSQALAINAAGDAVGVSDRDGFDQHGVLFHAGRVIALDSLLPEGSGWTLQTASGINDSGQIVGYGTLNGERRAFLLTPPPQGAATVLARTVSRPIVDPVVPVGPVGPPGSPTGSVPAIKAANAPRLYLHYDYMVEPGPNGHTDAPLPDAIRAVVAAFAAHGIDLRVDPKHVAIPERKVLAFHQALDPRALGPDGADFFALKNTYFTASPPDEHYLLFGYEVGCDNGQLPYGETNCEFASEYPNQIYCPWVPLVSGCSELPGQNSIVSLGGPFADIGFDVGPSNRFLFFDQGGTFMHEYGHSLGLHHGGGVGPLDCPDPTACDNINYKPNYLSVMSYWYQFNGIDSADAVGSDIADPTLTRLDYSGQVLPTGGPTPGALDERGRLDEPSGLGSGNPDLFSFGNLCAGIRHVPSTGPVDWNQNGSATDTNVTADVHGGFSTGLFGGPECNEYLLLRGHNDWADLLANLTNPATNTAGIAGQSSAARPNDQELTLTAAVEHGLIQVAPSRRWAFR